VSGAPPAPDRTLTAVIADDEELARLVVRECLGPHADVSVVRECANGFEAVRAVADLKPDLLFLDIQMPGLSGFEVLELVETDAAVVFITAYDKFAIKAFEVHAVDYLLKPFDQARFDVALERARRRAATETLPVAALSTSARPGGPFLDRILVREGARVHVIPVSELDYVAASDDYVTFVSGALKVSRQQTLAEVATQLDPARFPRTHRSFVVNLARVARIEQYARDSRLVVLSTGVKLPLSRAGHARLRELL
jgi:two-component system, LytTR family, response regulator